MYINESIPVKQLNSHKEDSETLFLEINLRLIKLLIVGAYKPPDQSKSVFFRKFIYRSLSMYLGTYENVILLGDFNMTSEDKNLQLFLLFQFRTSDKETNLFKRIFFFHRSYHHK